MTKPTCESTPAIDIRAWVAEGYLEPGIGRTANVIKGDVVAGTIKVVNHESAVVLTYRLRGKGGDNKIAERVEIDWTTPNLGGRRPWFLCPGCGHRRALLYVHSGRFRCRTCHGLTYASQRVGPSKRPPNGNQHGIGSDSDLTSEAEADERQSI